MRRFKKLFKKKEADKTRPKTQRSSTPTNQSQSSTSPNGAIESIVDNLEPEEQSSTAVSKTTTGASASQSPPDSDKQSSKFISNSITNARIALKHSLNLLNKVLEGVPIPGKGVFPVVLDIINIIEVFGPFHLSLLTNNLTT